MSDVTKGHSIVVGPDEGRSLWQPLPSRGYVTVNLSADNMAYDTFSSGIQILPPGCEVREHGHKQNHELVFIYEGSGFVEIDGIVTDLKPESTVLFARNCVHRLVNTKFSPAHPTLSTHSTRVPCGCDFRMQALLASS